MLYSLGQGLVLKDRFARSPPIHTKHRDHGQKTSYLLRHVSCSFGINKCFTGTERRRVVTTALIISHVRTRQVDITLDAEAERVEVTMAQPKACEVYYSACVRLMDTIAIANLHACLRTSSLRRNSRRG